MYIAIIMHVRWGVWLGHGAHDMIHDCVCKVEYRGDNYKQLNLVVGNRHTLMYVRLFEGHSYHNYTCDCHMHAFTHKVPSRMDCRETLRMRSSKPNALVMFDKVTRS